MRAAKSMVTQVFHFGLFAGARLALLAFFAFAGCVLAAPVLVDEATLDELSEQSWFFDVPVAAGGADAAMLNSLPADAASSIDSARPAYRPARDDFPARLNDGVAQRSHGPGQGNESLKEALRSYLRADSGTEANVRSAPGYQTVSVASRPAGYMNGTGRVPTEGLMARIASYVLQPVDGEGTSFAILGLNNVTLTGVNGGITLTFGDLFSLSLPGTGLDISWPGGFRGPGYALADLSGLAAATFQVGDTVRDSTDDRWARDEGENENGASSGAVEVFQAQEGGSQGSGSGAPHMLLLIYDILTYPATILMFLAFLLLPLVKVGKNVLRQRARRGHRLAKLRRIKRRRFAPAPLVSPPR